MSDVFPASLRSAAAALIARFSERSWRIAAAESCTGGLLAGVLTEIPGASRVFDRGYVTYSNAAKIEMLGVSPGLLASNGAVSAEVAQAMAEGALIRSAADVAVAITGIAGPEGGSESKPVGLVWFARAAHGCPSTVHERRFGALDRSTIRLAAVAEALAVLGAAAEKAEI